jgi:hypothetical protein
MLEALSGLYALPAIAISKLYVPSSYLVCQVLTFWQELLGDLPIGNTNTVVGCYKLLASLRCLAGWVMTTFKEWLELKVLQPNAVSRFAKGS